MAYGRLRGRGPLGAEDEPAPLPDRHDPFIVWGLVGLGAGRVPKVRAPHSELGGDEREQYFMFGMLSKQVHLAGRSFVGDRLERRTDGHHLRPKAAVAADLIRGVAVPAIAMLLASASRQLDLGLEVALDDLRLRLARWDPPVAAVAE